MSTFVQRALHGKQTRSLLVLGSDASLTKQESDNAHSHLRTIYLEMMSRAQFRPQTRKLDDLSITQSQRVFPEFNRFLYAAAGRDWLWTDRLSHTREHWLTYLDRAELETWVGYQQGTPVGFFELEKQPGDNVEIRIFGVMPFAVGQGIGGRLLSFAVERSWDWGAGRVWLHTCNRDHPVALSNYLARGFRIFSIVDRMTKHPLQPSWPG